MEQARGLCQVLAQGKTLPAAQWLVSLENRRIKREQLQELLQDAWLLTAQALLLQAGKPKDGTLPEEAELLSRSLSSRRLEGLSALLRQYSAECAYNVGAGMCWGRCAPSGSGCSTPPADLGRRMAPIWKNDPDTKG